MGKKHDLLIDDGQLLILETRLAVLIGDRQAIALQQLHYWVEINRKAKKETHFFDDLWWVYNTWNEWHTTDFPFWSVRTIRRVFDDLQEMKLVITRQHEDRNKGLWVAIDYTVLDGLTKASDGSGQSGQTGLDKVDRQSGQNEQPIGTTENTETTTEKIAATPNIVTKHVKEYLVPVFTAVANHIFKISDFSTLNDADVKRYRAMANIAWTKAGGKNTPVDEIANLVGCYAKSCRDNGYTPPQAQDKFSSGFNAYVQSARPAAVAIPTPPLDDAELEAARAQSMNRFSHMRQDGTYGHR